MRKIDRKTKININGTEETVKIIYNPPNKKKWGRDYIANVLVLLVPEGTTDEEIERRLNTYWYKNWIQGEKDFYKDSYKYYERDIKKKGFKLHYRTEDEFKRLLYEYIDKYKSIDGFRKIKSVTIKPMHAVLGKCKNKCDLIFNPILIYYPEELIEFVVYHEMSHTYCANHNPPFQRKLEEVYPNWREMDDNLTLMNYVVLVQNDLYF